MEPSLHEKRTEKLLDDLRSGDECNIDCYSQHVSYYEECLVGVGYKAPILCADIAMEYLKGDSSDMQALDICVGTGLASQELVNKGYKGKIDGIDGNEEMLEEARKKGIFRNLLKHIVRPQTPLPFQNETFDVVMIAGAFSAGHVNPDCITEFFRVMKSGGIITFNTTMLHFDANNSREVNISKADLVLAELVKKGICEKLKEVETPGFEASDQFKYQSGNLNKLHCYRKI